VLPVAWLLVIRNGVGSEINAWVTLYPWFGTNILGFGSLLWTPLGELWFLYAFIVYALFAEAVVAYDGWGRTCALAGVLTLLALYHLWRGEYFTYCLAVNCPFYMLGVLNVARIQRAIATPKQRLQLTMVYVGGFLLARSALPEGAIRGEAQNLFGTGLAVLAVVGLQAVPWLTRTLDAVGRRSLQIFLGPMPIMVIGIGAMRALLAATRPVLMWLG
jgi:hypothetical protein